jgi:hypothetical protein
MGKVSPRWGFKGGVRESVSGGFHRRLLYVVPSGLNRLLCIVPLGVLTLLFFRPCVFDIYRKHKANTLGAGSSGLKREIGQRRAHPAFDDWGSLIRLCSCKTELCRDVFFDWGRGHSFCHISVYFRITYCITKIRKILFFC